MFKFLFGHKRRYVIYYTMYPGTFVITQEIEAKSVYEANRLFDQSAPPEARRLPNSTELVL